jgi:ribose transport system ATP-binding protein
MVGDLSASEKQMVEISKALSFQSKLIIMDEPSSSLTADELKLLFKIIHDLREKGIAIIYITHKLDEIFELCDIVTILRDGMIVDTKPITDMTRDEMIAKMIGRELGDEFPERPHYKGDTILEVNVLNTRKLKDISFKLKKGEILGLVGLVGAGRTEIVRAIYGADKAGELNIAIYGQTVRIRKPRDGKRNGIGLLPEDRKLEGLVLPFSVQANIAMSSLEGITKLGFINSSKEREISDRQIKSLSIKTPSPHTKVKSLSGGNQQKCIMGRWLEISPDILILDEPTRGIDVGTKYEIYLLIKQIAENGGSVIMISSELPEVLAMSNRVLTICEGRINGEFNPEEESAHAIMDAAIG